MATNRLEDARRKLIEEDREVYNYIYDFAAQRCYDTAGDLAGSANPELANRLYEYSGISKARNQDRIDASNVS